MTSGYVKVRKFLKKQEIIEQNLKQAEKTKGTEYEEIKEFIEEQPSKKY
jgi:hypothetical protein